MMIIMTAMASRILIMGSPKVSLNSAQKVVGSESGMVAGGVVWDGRGRFSEFVVEKVAAFGGGI